MSVLKIREHLAFDEDVYLMRGSSESTELCFNLGYDRIRLFDVATRSCRDLMFPASVKEFLIYSWLLLPDGTRSFLFSSDPLDYALALDHRRLSAAKIALPKDFDLVTNLCWAAPDARIMTPAGDVWSIEGNALVWPQLHGDEKELATFYRTLTERYSVIRMESADGLCVIDPERAAFGLFSLKSGIGIMAPWNEKMIGFACSRGHLFACNEEEVYVFRNGRNESVLKAPEGCSLNGLQAGSAGAGGYLAVSSSMLDGRKRPFSFIDIYDLAPG